MPLSITAVKNNKNAINLFIALTARNIYIVCGMLSAYNIV
jgi:hypothetical protein